ncbi:hypothetical protein [Desulfoferrobacter suflitae]|uniref:hypothetical protein n=1 Tax=Desulfoferrobacter suflitae TaxID=2865782 RepID=UPI002164DA55|nr:hypothetical protein [Desulfoferrobacter suflitae]MCK8603307.1 hypothetical protein [Desulfoferrobacter suflitae]
MNNSEELEEIFQREGYSSKSELMQDWALLVALSRTEQYSAECEFFERKHGMKIDEFERLIHSEKGKEDFELEEDLEDWEFCVSALKWWQAKVKELQRVADAA